MSSIVYALLVGIDTYQPPVRPLYGCVNDIGLIEGFLIDRIPQGSRQLKVLKNERATRQAIIDGFLEHLCRAGPDDVALFYYSGHGSQAPTPAEFLRLEADGLDETLVCYDSRMPGKYDLADKEISKLVAEVAKKGPHIVVLLDSCHSGSATRAAESSGVRRVPTDERRRPMQSYLVTPSEVEHLESTRGVEESKTGWIRLPRGRHVVLSACQDDEEAKELRLDDQTRGVFSYFLLQTLLTTNGIWTYRDLFARVSALVRAKVARQSPVIEATDFQDLDRPFLGGAVRSHPPYFTVLHEHEVGWTLNGGAIHGIPQLSGDETTYLTVFPAQAENLEDLESVLGTARVTRVEPTRCQVALEFQAGRQPDPKETYKAIVTGLPLPPLGVRFEGDDRPLQIVRTELRRAGPAGVPSLLVQERDENIDLKLVAHGGDYRIARAGDDRPLYAFVEGGSEEERGVRAVAYLEHIARWVRMANLSNPATRLAPDAVRIDLFFVDRDGNLRHLDPADSGSGIRLQYEYRNDQWYEPRIKIKLTNNSNRRLYCMLFDLTDRFKVTAGLLPGGGVWLDPKPNNNEVWAYNDEPIPVSLPDPLWQQGMTEYKDLLKLIASTEKCDPTLSEQGDLEVRYETRSTRGKGVVNTLERIMDRVHTRDIGASSSTDRLPDWIAREIGITTVRLLEVSKLAGQGRSVPLAPEVTVVGHPHLRAMARLTTAPLASRDMIGMPSIPHWLRDDPTAVQPFELASSRSVDAGLNVLELSDVSEHETVTREQPLTIKVNSRLLPEEHVLPVAYDPESACFIPVGRAERSDTGLEIKLEQLPEPADTRSLRGSIKIFFEKVISEKLGFGFRYPLLGLLDRDCNYNVDLEQVRRRVDNARRILLYVHGIIGDTREMAVSGYRPKPIRHPQLEAIAQRYDLVLTFDYENLNTSIQANARLLKGRLENVGLGAGHGKTLHVVAHSMGGLVARWFIEREGGNAVVQHLVMLGTPNAGSPWPTVQDWATAAIGLGLNALTTIAWPAKVLGTLVSAIETIDVALDEMKPGSDLLAALEASPDPGTSYTVLAGNTSVIPEAIVPEHANQKSRVERLFASLRLRPALHKLATLAFFGSPNDVAVGVESITSLPRHHAHQVIIREVGCDHMSYFTTEEGLRALADALH